MKRSPAIVIALFGLCLSINACSDEKGTQQSGSAVFQPLKTTKNVGHKLNLLEVQKSIQEYHAANGRYPADLSEVAAFNGVTLESDKYVYDPATGTVTQNP